MLALLIGGGAWVVLHAAFPAFSSVSYTSSLIATPLTNTAPTSLSQEPVALHIETPEELKAIYMSQCVVGTPAFRASLVKLIEETELNAVVIDIKDYTGKIAFQTENPLLKDSVSKKCGAADMREFIRELHEKNIYVIGRITVFQDPHYASLYPGDAVQHKDGGVWKDNKGLAFVDVGARPFWDYIIAIAKESYALGFDELNFDYIRFPSDGPMEAAVFSHSFSKAKPLALEEFFKYVHENLKDTGTSNTLGQAPVLSADLFGMTTTVYDDMGIGQVLERALPYFDYIYPMIYPSHYPSGWNGFANVNEHAYDVIKISIESAVLRTVSTTTKVASLAYHPIASTSPQMYLKPSYPASKIRPWLQSFDYPVTYTPEMVKAQIKGSAQAGINAWLFWDAGNKYRALEQILLQVE